jgi:hypothetical protein
MTGRMHGKLHFIPTSFSICNGPRAGCYRDPLFVKTEGASNLHYILLMSWSLCVKGKELLLSVLQTRETRATPALGPERKALTPSVPSPS